MGRHLRHFYAAAAFLLSFISPAYGHAILLSAMPGISQAIQGPNVPITLRFNSRIDAHRSRLLLVTPSGDQRTLPINEKAPPDSLHSEVKGLAGGTYILRWQVLAADGHITRGEVPFRIQ
jgi:hypothetical protein